VRGAGRFDSTQHEEIGMGGSILVRRVCDMPILVVARKCCFLVDQKQVQSQLVSCMATSATLGERTARNRTGRLSYGLKF